MIRTWPVMHDRFFSLEVVINVLIMPKLHLLYNFSICCGLVVDFMGQGVTSLGGREFPPSPSLSSLFLPFFPLPSLPLPLEVGPLTAFLAVFNLAIPVLMTLIFIRSTHGLPRQPVSLFACSPVAALQSIQHQTTVLTCWVSCAHALQGIQQ